MAVTITGTGPTALRTFTFPDQNAKILTNANAVLASEGGTGATTLAAHGVLVGEGTGTVVAVGPDATVGKPLLSAGASADPAFGDLGVAHGGTGATTLTAHGVLIGEGASAVVATSAGTAGQVLTSNGAAADPTFQTISTAVDNAVCDVRLTLTAATPVTTGDVTGATNIFITPYKGNRMALFDGASTWNVRTFTEITQALGTLTNALPYDVFAFDNAGTVNTEILAWTSASARATALVLQDGVYVKSGATTRRYLGTFVTTATTTTEDSFAKRYVWNYYNRVTRELRVVEATDSWTYTTATYRQANAAAANQLAVVVGVAEVSVRARVEARASTSVASNSIFVSIGEDSTTTPATGVVGGRTDIGSAIGIGAAAAELHKYPAVGSHTYVWLERSGALGTTTWNGDGGDATTIQCGIYGSIEG